MHLKKDGHDRELNTGITKKGGEHFIIELQQEKSIKEGGCFLSLLIRVSRVYKEVARWEGQVRYGT
jgi:hypothetical protein